MSTNTFDAVAHALQRGRECPYDRSDDGQAAPAQDWAHEAARGILYDLTDRCGIKRGFSEIDEDVRVEIAQSLAEIMRRASDRPADAVPVPISVNMARLMLAMGYRYLQENAPEHLGSWERQHMADVPYSKVTGSRLVGFVVPAGIGVLPNGTPRDQLRRIICGATPPSPSTAEVQEQPKSASDAGAAQNCRSSSTAEVDERAAFEAWARSACNMPASVKINWDAVWTKAAYEGWQARAALASRPAVEARRPRVALDPELKAALDEAAKTRATGAILPDGSAVFINYGDQPGDSEDISCTVCGGSGHIEDPQVVARAALATKPATSAPGAADGDRAAPKVSFRAGTRQVRETLCGEPGAATQEAIHYPDQNGAA